MKQTTDGLLRQLEENATVRCQEIKNSKDACCIAGTVYYVSADGDDEADGLHPARAWKTLDKVNEAALQPGDGVLFCRGDIFRGSIVARAGVTYAAYGEGEKPRLYGWSRDLADPSLWVLSDAEHHIWQLAEPILDAGTLVMNGGETWCRKLIPSYIHGRFVCREEESRPFTVAQEMTQDLDLYWYYEGCMTTQSSKGEDFPVPLVDAKSYGTLYLRCDRGNPGEVFAQIEALPKRPMFTVRDTANVHIDNLCIRYVGHHAVSAGGHSVGLQVTNCEIGWIGGTIQHYFGTDPNYPQGRRGTVTRFGNAVEIYGGCEDYLVQNCYIYQCYDAGITHQITTGGKRVTMSHIRYLDNLVEKCVYAIEYFLDMTGGDRESTMDDVLICGNMLRYAGYGWGQQRHNVDTPALIKGWEYVNRAKDFVIENNLFDRCAYRMLHLVAAERASCPQMRGNTYVQHLGGLLGQYGQSGADGAAMLRFDENVAKTLVSHLGEREAKVYFVGTGE